ncbi:MAG: polysulfide reductase [Acidobacteria bacterium]|nr:MAG: polysulfide reductase [Acidobacteriota bacterium]
MKWYKEYLQFLIRAFWVNFRGGKRFYAWMAFLTILSLIGLNAFIKQFVYGMATTGMTDPVSWGFYIANFTYLVGIAAAAVMLLIPAYLYNKKELYEVVLFGEILAITALLMCVLFVVADLGHPDRAWHMLPIIGKFNLPSSMLSWDVLVVNGYLLINAHVVGYTLYMKYLGRPLNKWFIKPFVFVSIGWAVAVHTVTAFLLVGLGARPFWNTAILAPRFLASAFAAGPAFIIIAFQFIRLYTDYDISDKVMMFLRKIIQITVPINIFLFVSEVFKELYSDTHHSEPMLYLLFGLHGHDALVPWIWPAIFFNVTAMIILFLPLSRKIFYLNIACVLTVVGIWVEKGMGLVVPGFVPSTLGELVEYTPTANELLVVLGVWAFGFLAYSVMAKVAIPIMNGTFKAEDHGVN